MASGSSAALSAVAEAGQETPPCLGAERLGGYLFLGLLAFTVDLTWPLDPTFVLPFSLLAAAAIRVSALSVSAARRALCVALRWLARRLISLASSQHRVLHGLAKVGLLSRYCSGVAIHPL
jgi:hypothetical protein